MTLLEKIDAVFTWLYINSGKNPNLPDIEAGLNNPEIDMGEIKDILAKLWRDKFIYCVEGQNRIAQYSDFCNYLITFDGKLFYETVGGFIKQKEIEDLKIQEIIDEKALRKRNDHRLIVGTFLVAVGAIGLIAWEMYKTFCLEK